MSLESVTEYALFFGGDAVHLKSREAAPAGTAPPPWDSLGYVDFDDAGFREKLIGLRNGVAGGDTVPVMLVIPDDQILYTTLTVAPSADRENAVGRAMDGLTPYAIEDLAFDWDGDGDSVRVAAVARQTLREAQEFAAEYGFAGQGFRADPDPTQFPGEPIFVLDPPVRKRAVVDPALAGVTAAALMIQDDEPAADDLELPSDAPIQPDGVPLDALVASAAAAAGEKAPVVRHPPRTQPLPPAAGRSAEMNARARAVHDRAAEARKSRDAGSAPAAPPRPAPGYRGGLTGLVAMLGALVVGLVLIWAFVVPDDTPVQVVANAAPEPVVAAPPVAPVSQAAPETVAQSAPEPAPQIVAEPTPPAPTAAMPPPAQTAPAVAAQPIPAQSALTEAERRRVLVAAAAVAAAVVPPTTRAATEPVAQIAVAAARSEQAATPRAAPRNATPRDAARPDATRRPDAAPAATATPVPRPVTRTPAPPPRAAAPVAQAPAQAAPRSLSSSARPQLAPRRSTPQASVPVADAAPRVPSNPISYEASQQSAQPSRSARPPQRRAAEPTPAPEPEQSVSAALQPQASGMRGSARPPQRPEGSAPDVLDSEPLAPDESAHLGALIRDMNRYGLAQPDAAAIPGDARLAQARPQRRPAQASDAVSPSAVQQALRSASEAPPDRPATAAAAAAPARNSGGLLRGSARPAARPSSGVSANAVESALASAGATPGAVQLTALRASPMPPRKPDAPAATAAPATASEAAPEPSGAADAEVAARRALDEQLQAQAEARIRARAQADAAAEAQARSQAEARARAQAAAEERTARARRQDYKPPEIDNEPEIAAGNVRGGVTGATVAQRATQSRGMNTGRTTIIGIIGAGDASRALIRLRNGKIVTVRMGDRIDGGTINSIGDGKLTYVKAGRQKELRMLDGR